MVESQFFYTNETSKCRVVKIDDDWYEVQWKSSIPCKSEYIDYAAQWTWFLCGTREWLNLSDRDVEWAGKNYKPKKRAVVPKTS